MNCLGLFCELLAVASQLLLSFITDKLFPSRAWLHNVFKHSIVELLGKPHPIKRWIGTKLFMQLQEQSDSSASVRIGPT